MSSLRRVRNLLLVLVVLLLPSAVAPAVGARYPEIFPGDFDMARSSALERNAVVLIGVVQEGEETNEGFLKDVWQAPRFAEVARDAIVMVVNDGEHPTTKLTETTEDGEQIVREVCASYHTATCAVHKRLWNVCYQEFNTDGDMRTPQLIVLSPDGTEFGRRIDVLDLKDNLALIEEAMERAGPSLSVEELGHVKQSRKLGQTHAGAGRHGEAWHAWQAILALTTTSTWADEARAGVAAAEQGYDADVANALARLEQGEVVAGWSQLVAIGEAWAGSPKEKDHAKLVRKVEKDKRYKDAIEAHKDELAADALWVEVEALLAADEERDAIKLAKRLVRKYPGTKAAEKARRSFPELDGEG